MVTQSTLYTPIERCEINPSRESQSWIHFESTDQSETVQIVTNSWYRVDGGKIRTRSNWGTRKCVLKPQAREIWREYIRRGYSVNIKGMDEEM